MVIQITDSIEFTFLISRGAKFHSKTVFLDTNAFQRKSNNPY